MARTRYFSSLAHERFAPEELLAQAVAAERAGFDGISCSDHWLDPAAMQSHAQATVTDEELQASLILSADRTSTPSGFARSRSSARGSSC